MHLIEIPLEWEALGRNGLVGAISVSMSGFDSTVSGSQYELFLPRGDQSVDRTIGCNLETVDARPTTK